MASTVSKLLAHAIEGLVFEPPKFPGYLENDAEYVKTIDGARIATMLLQPVPSGFQHPRDLILYSHGNAEDIGHCKQRCLALADNLDCNVLVYDYVNYGHSSAGAMSEEHMYSAILAVYEYASRQLEVSFDHLFIMGRSLGTTASTRLARILSERHRADGMRLYRGLILESPLASGFRVLFDGNRLPAQVSSVLDSLLCPVVQDIPLVDEHVFVIHGVQDEVISVRNAYLIQESVRTSSIYPPLYVDAGHNDIETLHGRLVVKELRRFLTFCRTGLSERS